MKTKSIFMIGGLTILTSVLTVSCDTAADNVSEAQSDVNDANEELALANEEYQEDVANYRLEMAEMIAVNDSLIVDLKSKSKASDKGNPYYEVEIEELEKQNREMDQKMKDYKGDEQDNWATFKEELSHDMDELGEALRDLTIKNTK